MNILQMNVIVKVRRRMWWSERKCFFSFLYEQSHTPTWSKGSCSWNLAHSCYTHIHMHIWICLYMFIIFWSESVRWSVGQWVVEIIKYCCKLIMRNLVVSHFPSVTWKDKIRCDDRLPPLWNPVCTPMYIHICHMLLTWNCWPCAGHTGSCLLPGKEQTVCINLFAGDQWCVLEIIV